MLRELILIGAYVGIAVTLYPVVRKQNEAVALGHVRGRLLEAGIRVLYISSYAQPVPASEGRLDPGVTLLYERSARIAAMGHGRARAATSLMRSCALDRAGWSWAQPY